MFILNLSFLVELHSTWIFWSFFKNLKSTFWALKVFCLRFVRAWKKVVNKVSSLLLKLLEKKKKKIQKYSCSVRYLYFESSLSFDQELSFWLNRSEKKWTPLLGLRLHSQLLKQPIWSYPYGRIYPVCMKSI